MCFLFGGEGWAKLGVILNYNIRFYVRVAIITANTTGISS
jgi:hypothetical protein